MTGRHGIVAALVIGCNAPQPVHHRTAVHGMLLFGDHAHYLSHLPLFHAPHDYQVIIAADMPAQLANDTYYTFVPTPFALPDFIASPFHLRGDIVRGHFERGGTTIARDVEVAPRVIYAHQLVAGGHSGARYLMFGTPGEQYLVHLIGGPPDFDQVVAVDGGDLDASALHDGVEITAPPLVAGATVTVVRADGRAMTLAIGREIYRETGDLAE
jgi:hypothetical protein